MSEEQTQHLANVEHTAHLAQLFTVPREQRDDAWIEEFLTWIPQAAFRCSEERVFNGPDGFLYFGLFMPKEGETFNAVSLQGVSDFCSKEGLGIAVFNEDENDPEWVFNYGSIWNYFVHNNFYNNPYVQQPQAEETITEGESDEDDDKRSETVLVSSPSEEYLPLFVRAVMLRDLDQQKVAEPSVLLMTVPNEATYLVFNVFSEDFEEEHFEFLQQYLMWALPQGYSIASIAGDSELAGHFTPIREMLENPLN